MIEHTYPVEHRVHTLKDGRTVYLIPEVACDGCVATAANDERDPDLCHSMPPCGGNDGWVEQDAYIKWLAEERMK